MAVGMWTNGGEESRVYTVYMEAETDTGGVSMAWGWGGVGEGDGCSGRGVLGVVQVCACAWGTHIATRHHTPNTRHPPGRLPGACFPAIVTRSAGALCERACGMSFTCRHHREVVRLSATSVMLAGAAQRDACDGVCACAPALQG